MANNSNNKPNKPKGKWQETNESFVNPYSFMPVRGTVIRTDPEQGTLSGKIICTIKAVTPLAIPDHERKQISNDLSEHYIYPFFSKADGTHLISGSSVRGVVRSMFETITNSCFSVNNNNILSARHSHQRLPGILKKVDGKWQLFSARKNKYNPDIPLNGDQVLRVWYDIGRQHNVKSVFTIGTPVQCSELEKAVNDYRECLEIYRKNAEKEGGSKFELYNRSTNTLNEKGMTPLFYELVGKGEQQIVYLSPAQISRSVFHNKLNDLLGDHISCMYGDGEKLCETCTLFGIISKNGKARASRVRFSDAKEVNFISAGYHTLKELASPKTTSVEFYTERPDNAVAWNYDYKTVRYEKKPIMFKGKSSMDVPVRELADASVKGRKFYLHTEQNKYETSEVTKRNSTMELADMGSTFNFEVYFDNITEKQLSRFVWTLTLGENTEDSFRLYKLGHGKPLGLGSAKIIVDKVLIRNYDKETFSYTVTEMDIDSLVSESGIKVSKALERLIGLKTTEGMNVSYPIAEDKTRPSRNSKAAHQWFAANRTANGTGTAWNYKHVLPDISDPNITLPVFEKVKVDEITPDAPKSYSFGDDGGTFGGGIMTRKRGQNNNNSKNKKK